MAALATAAQRDRWWDHAQLQQRWRAYHLTPTDRLAYLREGSAVFGPAFARFAAHLAPLPPSPLRQRWRPLRAGRTRLEKPTQQTLAGPRPLDTRLVSRDALDARPIKHGQSHPRTAWGPTLQMPCNRQGFLSPTDHCLGQPNATPLSGPPLERVRKRMQASPGPAVPALGLRSAPTLTRNAPQIDHVFMGRRAAGEEPPHEACRPARAAPAGLRAVAKHLRGFARSLSRGLHGAIVWTRLSQCADNLPKCLQLSRAAALEASTLRTLRL
jgi:hypothetical protein